MHDEPPRGARERRMKPRGEARRRARELALQGLYQRQLGGAEPATIRANWEADPENAGVDRAFLDELWRGVNAEQDAMLAALSPHLDRAVREVSPIERSVLVIAAWELTHRLDTPYRVVINEAVELAKAYGGIEGHRFVNGVLDKLAARVRAPEIAARARESAGGKRE